jgi:hypothetical protein
MKPQMNARELKLMSITAANVVCLRHPKYSGVESPDLNCKVCCSKFVERIRSEQKKLFEVNQPASQASAMRSEFSPMSLSNPDKVSSKRQANFDGAWI